jgi:hypothetical protein
MTFDAPHYLQIENVVLLGRTFDEYCRMFALDFNVLRQEVVLDAGGGVSSFCAEGNARGCNITAADVIYAYSAQEIARKCAFDLEEVMAKLPAIADLYMWKDFPTVEALTQQRERAYRAFLPDYEQHGQSRYVPTTLPQSGFETGAFTLTLCSHLLFLYEDHLDYAFHRDTLKELLRVTSGEVRIFPITNLRGERCGYLDLLLEDEAFGAYQFEIVRVNYEFLKNANQMLCVFRADSKHRV